MNEDLNSLNERADRLADGITVNRDALARDIKRLTAELAQWRKAHAEKPTESAKDSAYDDLMGGLFGGGFRPR